MVVTKSEWPPSGHRGPTDPLSTYRSLRLGLTVLLALLVASLAREIFSTSSACLQTSISSYYYTPVRAVFIASLCAIGTCLVVYKGNSRTESLLLSFTGLAEFVVAFVPTGVDTSCRSTNVPGLDDLAAGITNTGWSLTIAGAVAVVLVLALRQGTPLVWTWKTAKWSLTGWQRAYIIWLVLISAAVAIDFLFFVFWRASFVSKGHAAAAIATFVGITLTVVANALSFARHNNPEAASNRLRLVGLAARYTLIAIVMIVTLVALIVAHYVFGGWRQWLFFLEASSIAEFAWFWIVQSQELWGVSDRSQLPRRHSRKLGSHQ